MGDFARIHFAVLKTDLCVLCGGRNSSRLGAKCAKRKNDFKSVVLRESFYNPVYFCVLSGFA